MADCSQLAFNINLGDFGYNPSLFSTSQFPDFTKDLMLFFSPFPAIPGNIELPPISEPTGLGNPVDTMANLLDKMPPLMGALAPIFSIMNIIKCILDVICAIPNPFQTIKAVLVLFTECLPPFIAFLPPFYMAYLIMTLIRMLIALLTLILECIVSTVESLIAAYEEVMTLIEDIDNPAAAAYLTIVKLVCELGSGITTCFGPINVLQPLLDFIAPFLGLAESSVAWDFSFCKRTDDDDDDPCPPADEMARYLENPNDPTGFSFDPSTVPVTCYPAIQNQIRMFAERYGQPLEPIPVTPDLGDLISDLNGAVAGLAAIDGEDPLDYLDRVGDFLDTNGDQVTGRINEFIDDLRCVLYGAACNALDAFSTTFESDKVNAVANGVDFVTLTIIPRDVAGNAIGPVGYGRIPSPYEPMIATTMGEVFDLQENTDGSFSAKIKSSEIGTATVCAFINCNTCSDEELAEDDEESATFTVTMKTIDGRIITRTVVSIEALMEDNQDLVALQSISEIPALDGYGASEFEIVTDEKCIDIDFVAVIAPPTVRQGACE